MHLRDPLSTTPLDPSNVPDRDNPQIAPTGKTPLAESPYSLGDPISKSCSLGEHLLAILVRPFMD
jgi:hypothetical protein